MKADFTFSFYYFYFFAVAFSLHSVKNMGVDEDKLMLKEQIKKDERQLVKENTTVLRSELLFRY